MEEESRVTRSISDELYTSDVQRDQKRGESGVTQSIIDEVYSWDIRVDQLEGESGVN